MEHVVATLKMGDGTIALNAEFEGGAVWVHACRKDPSMATSWSPSDQVHYVPDKGWALKQQDPRGGWPRHTVMSLESAVEHMLTYVVPTGPDRLVAYALMEAALMEAVPALDVIFVMDS